MFSDTSTQVLARISEIQYACVPRQTFVLHHECSHNHHLRDQPVEFNSCLNSTDKIIMNHLFRQAWPMNCNWRVINDSPRVSTVKFYTVTTDALFNSHDFIRAHVWIYIGRVMTQSRAQIWKNVLPLICIHIYAKYPYCRYSVLIVYLYYNIIFACFSSVESILRNLMLFVRGY